MTGEDAAVERIASVVGEALGDELEALILYGSAVQGGLRPDSDVDLLAVLRHPLSDAARVRLDAGLLRTSGARAYDGPARPAEVTVGPRTVMEVTAMPTVRG